MSDTSARPDQTLRVLFVCTANISRSPYAERRAAHLLAGAGTAGPAGPAGTALAVASAGVPGLAGREMDPAMVVELEKRGGSSTGHVSRAVSAEILDSCDLVLTVEFAHRLRILDAWPEHGRKLFGVNQLADAVGRVPRPHGGPATLDAALEVARPDSLAWDVADPYRRGRRAAKRCADEIDEALAVILPALDGIRTPAGLGRLPGRW